MESLLYWLTAFASLLAVVLNIRKHVLCFWIWSITNSVWVYADVTHGLPAQAALQGAYLALAVYGIISWTPRAKKKEPQR